MWKGPGQDPGGGPDSEPPPPNQSSSQELSDLKDQFEQQQVLIAQLKEMIRKNEQTNVTQEKVDQYMSRLTKMSAGVKKGKLKKLDDDNRKTAGSPATEKINLLRQQLEENKVKLAERGKSQKGIEEMVTQLQAQMDDSRHLISETPLNMSLQDSKIEYSPSSSSEELYNILVAKEKRVSDLLAKVHKLESNVLDLQENLKEKDSVIDARTKAITLMTENLSRKGKNTLDALDETKEQMRKMQENFVTLEADMKARQMKLLDDLRLKNYEIAELQELNSALEQERNVLVVANNELKEKLESTLSGVGGEEITGLQERVKELENLNAQLERSSPQKGKKNKGQKSDLQPKLDSLTIENDRLTTVISQNENAIKEFQATIALMRSKESDISSESEAIAKLKKQLDESNKGMIKVKAQHKSKIKELTKKIEEFKKISDVNAEIVKLESENCRLSQRVAELEEEKGSLQLKLVEELEMSKKVSELEEKCRDQDDKDKIIELLEAEIVKLKCNIDSSKERLDNLSQLENVQVTSAITSIHFEEQMDALEKQKKELMVENSNFMKEKEGLLEKIESLKKEKQELSMKLENYIHENMELIDKLEKLSAEKVSSAESIEIVEGLTQQEKLELEAYQKNLDLASGNLKTSEENLPQSTDLNESVNELTEETSELLQKIELFTIERREVMEKMEQLKQENNRLNLKIQEVENNRDVLAETYEQLQTEKENLDTKLEAIEKENELLKEKTSQDGNELSERIEQLEERCRQLMEENGRLLENLERSHEESWKVQLDEATSQIDELKQEIENYRAIGDEKATELERLSTSVNQLQLKLKERENENVQLNNSLIDITKTLTNFENENANLQRKVAQLEETKTSLNELIEKGKEELEVVNNFEWEHRRLLESKENEIKKLIKERDNTESVIANLQKAIKDKDETFHSVSSDLKDKYLALQKKLEANSGSIQDIRKPLEAKVEELTNKNKEQLEKMKKIAANLKKKNQAFQELEEKFRNAEQKFETELREKDAKISDTESKVASLLQQMQELEGEVCNLQGVIRENSNKYQSALQNLEHTKSTQAEELNCVENRNVELQNIITDLRVKLDKASEVSLQQEFMQTRESLPESQINDSSLQFKIQELEMVVEAQDSELTKYRERVSKLEEGISMIEEKRLNLEKKTVELGAQLEEKAQSFEEISKCEDLMEDRLAALAAHDEAIEMKLESTISENHELTKQNQELADANAKLQKKLDGAMEELKNVESNEQVIEELESKNSAMKQQIQHLEAEVKHLQSEYERVAEESREELEKMNGDWQSQCEEMLREKAELMVKCEKLEEEFKEIVENEVVFSNELSEYKVKLEKSENEIRNYEEQIQALAASNEEQLRSLKRQLEEKNAEKESYKSPPQSFFGESPQSTRKLEEVETARLQEVHQLPSKDQNVVRENVVALETSPSVVSEIPQPVPTFVWSDHGHDPFDFVSNQPVQEPVQEPIAVFQENQVIPESNPIQYNQEELLSKIKTLEFMLYSVEKAKDDALLQCHEMSNELTRLVYERENVGQQPQIPDSGLETQILSEAQILNTPDSARELRSLEFEPTKPPIVFSEDTGPIVEDILEPKTAYLCYPDEPTKVDSQIVSKNDTKVTPESRKELHDIEFIKTQFDKGKPIVSIEKTGPVVEEPCHSKTAYLCYPDEPKTSDVDSQIVPKEAIAITPDVVKKLHDIEFAKTKPPSAPTGQPVAEDPVEVKEAYLCYDVPGRDTFGENDDGWGWGPEESKLEAEHVQRSEATPLMKQIESLKGQVRVLEIERENHLEEIKQLQIKSGKLIKKLKEMKVKNSELTKKSEGDFFNLDDTIQEELKLQIQQVEKKLKETSAELEKEKVEKATILKRVDVLTSANERMVEMKEKQDVELLGWQRNCRELSAKLERFEWGDEDFTATEERPEPKQSPGKDQSGNTAELSKKMQELNDTIKELTLDNEELQTLLEEQRVLRINAEKSKSVEPIAENVKSEAEYLQVLAERNSLDERVKLSGEEKRQLQSEVNELIKKNSELLQIFNDLKIERENLVASEINKDLTIERLQIALDNIEAEKSKIIEELHEQLRVLENEKLTLSSATTEQLTAVTEYQNRIDRLDKEKEEICRNLAEKDAEILNVKQTLEAQIESLRCELDNERTSAQILAENIKQLSDSVVQKDSDLAKLSEESSGKDAVLEAARNWEMKLSDKDAELEEAARNWEMKLSDKDAELEEAARNWEMKLSDKDAELEEAARNWEMELSRKDAELATTLEQVARDWEMRVDQRGNDVAESWKLHLESRETEFAQIENILRKEINELEEKCNALVNENNELRKNVDAEIRNEVDRVSALQQQISDRQQAINELTKIGQDKQAEIDQLTQDIVRINAEMTLLRGEVYSKNLDLSLIQKQYEEEKGIVDAVIAKLEEGGSQVISRDHEMVLGLFGGQLSKFYEETVVLRQQIEELKLQLFEISTLNQENSVISESYQQKIEENQVALVEKDQTIASLSSQLQQQNSAISESYHQKLEESQVALVEKDKTIASLSSQLQLQSSAISESYHQKLEESQVALVEKDKTIASLSSQLQQVQNLKEYEDDSVRNLQQHLNEYQQINAAINAQLQENNSKFESLLNDYQNCQALLQQKESEIGHFKSHLEEKEREHAYALENFTQETKTSTNELLQEIEALKRRLLESENRYEELLSIKDVDLGNLQLQLNEQSEKIEEYVQKLRGFDEVSSQLAQKMEECRLLEAKIVEQNVLLEEENKQLTDLRHIVENQVLKIEELNRELYQKSNDYDSLIAEMDMSHSDKDANKREVSRNQVEDDDLAEPASRAELNLALYMLHQRDVRCEELTVELTQLLEERDTLQLRLSNALREKEELWRRKEDGENLLETSGAIPKIKTEAATKSVENVPAEPDQLANKLSELRTLGYNKDKTIVDEQEVRRLQAFSIMQQHRDAASKLPPEAAARLVDASYTLSRDVQSPSKVLLNWLWGKSTPKVNNI